MNVPLLSCWKKGKTTTTKKKEQGAEAGGGGDGKERTGEEKNREKNSVKGDERRVVAIRLLLSQRSDNYDSRASPAQAPRSLVR